MMIRINSIIALFANMFSKVVSFLFSIQGIYGFLVPDAFQIVQTRNGEIQGLLSNVEFSGVRYQVNKFLGIPYAQPPVGELRFRKPLPPKPFSSPFRATKYSPSCVQILNKTMSEDCLYLNIIVPIEIGMKPGKGKPVMVWIHGGGYVGGGGSSYDVDKISAFTNTVVVTINYRLGALGFFSTGDEAAAGNYAFWDQHQALRWVQDNIAAFGGDPDIVTIFGESAGSSSVIFQTAYPGNRGLFRRAIAESGTMFAFGSAPQDLNYEKSISFAARCGCNGTHEMIVSCLQKKSSEEIVIVAKKNEGYDHYPYLFSWVPVYDNDFVIKDPIKTFVNPEKQSDLFSWYQDLDLLIGWNRLDGLVYVPKDYGVRLSANFTLTRDQFENIYLPDMTKLALNKIPTVLAKSVVLQEYTNFENPDDGDEILKNLAKLTTDATLAAPTIRTANAHVSSSANTFVYRFSAKPPYRFYALPPVLDTPENANHGEDLFYVFGSDFAKSFVFPDSSQVPKRTASEMRITKAIMTMWGNFAKTGDPNQPTPIKQYYDVHWDAYTKDNPVFLEISFNMTQASVKSSKNLRGVDFWNNILPRVQEISN